MKRKNLVLIIFVVSLSVIFIFSQEKKEEKVLIALVGGTLIDGTGASPLANTVVLIEGDEIKAVGPPNKVKIPKQAKKVDVSGKWILPGFTDLHIHLTYPNGIIQHFTDTDSLASLRALHFMKMYSRNNIF